VAFATSAAGLFVLAVVERAPLELYPRFAAPVDGGVLATAAAVAAVALLPFCDRRGTGR
jgi:hypothetical protein